MRKLFIGISVLFVMLLSIPARTQSNQVPGKLDFKFVNETGKTLYAFFVTETKDDHWGEDLLPEDLVENDDEVEVTFEDDDDGDCHWDVKVSLDEHDTKFLYVRGIDMCKVAKLTFYMDNGVCKYKAE